MNRFPTLWGGAMTAEARRMALAMDRTEDWKRWGPYLSERAWGTVREDYSPDGSAWEYFPHEHARSRAYRWNEDGLGGICDRRQILCFALALWNGRDPILKERLFGVTGPQGNHGEDCKEYYFYLDSTPTHSYMKFLYKYPQAPFPYGELIGASQWRGKRDPEPELLDTGVFHEDRYFDVTVEYAKAGPDDVLIRITATNKGPEAANIHLLPTLWYRNTWAWEAGASTPRLVASEPDCIKAEHPDSGPLALVFEGGADLLFTENDSNLHRLYGAANPSPYVKDAFHARVVADDAGAVNPGQLGSKAAVWYRATLAPGASHTVKLRLGPASPKAPSLADFDAVFAQRLQEADEYYQTILPASLAADDRQIARQAFAGMLWTKQFYHFVISKWLAGDPTMPPPPDARRAGRNSRWSHLWNEDVISMPDKWEYPWYAAWDLAFHCVTLALIDVDFAKRQLLLMLREWYQHPNGQLPAYEWKFEDVNPPVHAWAALRVYEIEKRQTGRGDRAFLEKVFHKLVINFTWWVNQKDTEGNNIFEGGFLGLDNIGVFDRSSALPTGGSLEQSDGSSWMAMYTLDLLAIACELARENAVYEDVASKFFEHYVYIAEAMNEVGKDGVSLWDETDGFYYDMLHLPDGRDFFVRMRSMVGLIPLYACRHLPAGWLERMPGFAKRFRWFLDNEPDLIDNCGIARDGAEGEERLLSLVSPDRLRRILRLMLDEREFLSRFGVRSLSRVHRENPYIISIAGQEYRVDYDPAESTTGMFGGNSNWRGPIWFPVNFMLIESLRRYHSFLGDGFKIECPTGSGRELHLGQVADFLAERLCDIFRPDAAGRRPVYGGTEKFQIDPDWKDLVLFFEYFHGDDGAGLGASHQTGWTGLVANLLCEAESTATAQRKVSPAVAAKSHRP